MRPSLPAPDSRTPPTAGDVKSFEPRRRHISLVPWILAGLAVAAALAVTPPWWA